MVPGGHYHLGNPDPGRIQSNRIRVFTTQPEAAFAPAIAFGLCGEFNWSGFALDLFGLVIGRSKALSSAMLSYQHAYHAGNPADLHKHLALAELLGLLIRKPRGISYMETHAGRGRYDLGAAESRKTGEANEGINALALPDCPLRSAIGKTRARFGDAAYPGSPLIAQTLLREQDRLHLMELHPAEFGALRKALRSENTAVHHRDGYEGVLSLSPPRPRKGLVLIDPSYEVKTEYAKVADFTHRLMRKWPEATVMIWYPLLRAGQHEELLAGLKLKYIRHEVSFDLLGGEGMQGSGLVLVNAPYGSDAILERVLSSGQPVLRHLPR